MRARRVSHTISATATATITTATATVHHHHHHHHHHPTTPRQPPTTSTSHSGKACTLHPGTSFVEACIEAGLTRDPDTGEPYFGRMDTFVSYTWRGEGLSLIHI